MLPSAIDYEALAERLSSVGFNGLSLDAESFETLAANPAANTKLSYSYRDENGYTQNESVVLTGVITPVQIDTIVSRLGQDDGFIPGQVGLPDLQPRMINGYDPEVDHPYHEIGRIMLTLETPPHGPLADLVAAFEGVTWDEAHEPA